MYDINNLAKLKRLDENNTEAMKADYRNGVLAVRMPKREESRPKQIKIGVTSNGKS